MSFKIQCTKNIHNQIQVKIMKIKIKTNVLYDDIIEVSFLGTVWRIFFSIQPTTSRLHLYSLWEKLICKKVLVVFWKTWIIVRRGADDNTWHSPTHLLDSTVPSDILVTANLFFFPPPRDCQASWGEGEGGWWGYGKGRSCGISPFWVSFFYVSLCVLLVHYLSNNQNAIRSFGMIFRIVFLCCRGLQVSLPGWFGWLCVCVSQTGGAGRNCNAVSLVQS